MRSGWRSRLAKPSARKSAKARAKEKYNRRFFRYQSTALVPVVEEPEEEAGRRDYLEDLWDLPLLMLGAGIVGSFFYLIFCVVICGFLEEPSEVPAAFAPATSKGFRDVSAMPAQWDRRYYRTSESAGQELLLLKRIPGARGMWVCVRPDNSIAKVNLQLKSTIATQPLAVVTYVPASAMAVPMRNMLVGQAEQVVAGTLACPTLTPYRAGRRGWARAFLVLAAIPSTTAQPMRWCLRSK